MLVQDVAPPCFLRVVFKRLIYQGCDQLTDEAIKAMKDLVPNLQDLNLFWCKRLTAVAMKQLPRGLKTLHLSSWYGCITDEIIKDLPYFQTLLILRCEISYRKRKA